MIYSVKGKVTKKGDGFVVLQAGPVGVKIQTNRRAAERSSGEAEFFCRMYIREEEAFLYGFPDEKSLRLFEMLTSVSGVGPKTALNVLDLDEVEKITAAIIEKREELLSRAAGIGKKAAGRIILELHNKLDLSGSDKVAERMDVDHDVEAALVNLGYDKRRVKEVISGLGKEPEGIEGRLKEALKRLR